MGHCGSTVGNPLGSDVGNPDGSVLGSDVGRMVGNGGKPGIEVGNPGNAGATWP